MFKTRSQFDKIFLPPTTVLRISRFHPEIKQHFKWWLRLILTYIYIYLTVLMVILGTTPDRNLEELCYNILFAVISVILSIKIFVLTKHQQKLRTLISNIEKDYRFSKTLSDEEQNIVNCYKEKGKFVSKIWLTIVIANFLFYVFKPVFLMIYHARKEGTFQLILLMDVRFIKAIDDLRTTLVPFIILDICLLWFLTVNSMMYAGFEPMGPIFLTHACGQLELLSYKVNNLFSNDKITSSEKRETIKYIARKLQDVYRFVAEMQAAFEIVYEVTLKSSSLSLPVATFQVIKTFSNTGVLNIELLTLLFGGVTVNAFPCFYGQMLIEKGEELYFAIYSSGWEVNKDWKIRKSLLILLVRLSKPPAIRTVFRTLELATLTEVYQLAYTIFNLLCAVY